MSPLDVGGGNQDIETKRLGEQENLSNLLSVDFTPLGGVTGKDHNFTGSCNQIEVVRAGKKPQKIIIDYGYNQGNDNDETLNRRQLFSPSNVDSVVVTHTHLDHMGLLPTLTNGSERFEGSVHTTFATSRLLEISLADSARIAVNESNRLEAQTRIIRERLARDLREYQHLIGSHGNSKIRFDRKNKRDRSFERRKIEYLSELQIEDISLQERLAKLEWSLKQYGIEKNSDIANVNREKLEIVRDSILYNPEDVTKFMSYVEGMSFYERKQILPGIFLKFYKSAHTVGSAQVVMEIDKGNGEFLTLGLSGDLGRWHDPFILGKPDIPVEPLDFYLSESTYGGRLHIDRQKERLEIAKAINETFERNGKIIIPAFMLQRLQDVVVFLIGLQDEGLISKDIPIFMDGGSIEQINNVFVANDIDGTYKDAFSRTNVRSIRGNSKNNEFMKYKGSAILVAPSGMIVGGTITKYLRLLEEKKNSIFFVGYQAEGTIGRKIVDGFTEFLEVPGTNIILSHIAASVHYFKSFSGHGDHKDIVSFLRKLNFKKNAILAFNHGDPLSVSALMYDVGAKSRALARMTTRVAAQLNQTIEIFRR